MLFCNIVTLLVYYYTEGAKMESRAYWCIQGLSQCSSSPLAIIGANLYISIKSRRGIHFPFGMYSESLLLSPRQLSKPNKPITVRFHTYPQAVMNQKDILQYCHKNEKICGNLTESLGLKYFLERKQLMTIRLFWKGAKNQKW